MKKIKKILTISCCVLCSHVIHAQKENYNWAFGYNAGLSWNATQDYPATGVFGTTDNPILSGIPTSFHSSIQTSEGCFAVSSSDGQLMFYSDGMTIWNKNHTPMPNGTGLAGNASSSQSGIIIPYPGQGGKYIVIAVGANLANNLSYSVVDMSLNNGLGDIVPGQKNMMFTGAMGATGETVTAVRAANYRDYWIVAIGRTTTDTYFNVWRVNLNGVNTAAVTANTVTINKPAYQTVSGYMTFNADGTMFWYNGYNTLNDATLTYAFGTFDTATGKFGTIKTKTAPYGSSYSTAFSPNNKYVYVTHIGGSSTAPGTATTYNSYLEVYDIESLMSAADPNTVAPLKNITSLSQYQYNDGSSNSDAIGGVLLGPDGRMYVATAYNDDMYVIPNPDSDPTNLKIYKLNNILGFPIYARWGLPVYAAMYFNVTLGMPTPPVCMEKEAIFNLGISGGAGSDNFTKITIDWGDGSPLHTINTPSINTTYPISHTYEHNGDYIVAMTSYDNNNMKIDASSSTQAVHVSNCRMPVNPNVRSRMDGAVLINGVYWAKANVDAPGTFPASPELPGMLYQWNRKTAWPATGTISGWDTSYSTADTWEPANDPCPPGWRMPTYAELQAIHSVGNTKLTSVAKTVNGITGVEITDIANRNTIFLPTVSFRDNTGSLNSSSLTSHYWSTTPSRTTNAQSMQAWGSPNRGATNAGNHSRAAGLSCRCVAK